MNKISAFSELEHLTEYDSFKHIIAEIVYKDFCGTAEDIKHANIFEKLDYNELLLLMGLWVKNVIPSKRFSKKELLNVIKQVYQLLEDIHKSLKVPSWQQTSGLKDILNFKEMFFYTPTGAYDIQYARLVSHKYSCDRKWIKESTGLLLDKLYLYFFMIKRRFLSRLNDKKYISTIKRKGKLLKICSISKRADKNLFRIEGFERFLEYYAISLNQIPSNELKDIGDFNPCREKPIIKLDKSTYFIPSTFHLAEAMWESFFYKMMKSNYKDKAAKHRGDFAEEIVYRFMSNNFKDTYRNLQLERGKGEGLPDIDVCVIEGRTMILFMVKSKRLTLLSRKGNVESAQNDFRLAIEESFQQGLSIKNCILSRKYKIRGNKVPSEKLLQVTDIFIYTVVLDDYPFLHFQNHIFIDKSADMPISISIFDLETILNYILDAEGFIKYTRKRYSLLKKINMTSELSFLELFKTKPDATFEEYDRVLLDNDWSLSIDSDFYYKLLRGEYRQLIPGV